MGFAFVALPLSNQGFCNGDPLNINYYLADCTTTISSTSDDCDGSGPYSLSITITTTNAETVDVSIQENGGAYNDAMTNVAYVGMTVTVTFTNIPVTVTNIDITATSSGAGCTTPGTGEAGNHMADCTSGCQNCFTGNAMLQDANGAAEGGEICGTVNETFRVSGDLTSNGTIGSPALPNRVQVHEFGNCAEYTGGFEVFLGSDVTIMPASVTCPEPPSIGHDHDSRFTATPTTQVKISPNPVTNIAQIQYNIAEEGRVLVSVFDLKGNRVAVIANGNQMTGTHTVDFDASNLVGGFYYLTVQTASTQVTERMVIVK